VPDATLDIPKVAERRDRADDFCHGGQERSEGIDVIHMNWLDEWFWEGHGFSRAATAP
jgi:hypothetical protein